MTSPLLSTLPLLLLFVVHVAADFDFRLAAAAVAAVVAAAVVDSAGAFVVPARVASVVVA